MFHPRKILIAAGALILLVGGYSAWRASHPLLNDTQQLTANLEAVRTAVEARDTRTIASYLSDNFSWNGQSKRELNGQLTGVFWQARDITANISGLKVTVDANSATTEGQFSLTMRPSSNSRAEAYVGKFKLFWQKQNGNWQVVKAEGGENIQ